MKYLKPESTYNLNILSDSIYTKSAFSSYTKQNKKIKNHKSDLLCTKFCHLCFNKPVWRSGKRVGLLRSFKRSNPKVEGSTPSTG